VAAVEAEGAVLVTDAASILFYGCEGGKEEKAGREKTKKEGTKYIHVHV
jgi:hypothetical protein